MANQDILFPLMPRTTQVNLHPESLRITQIQKKPRSAPVSDEEKNDDTQQARVHQRMHEQPRKKTGPLQPPATAADPRKTDARPADDDEHKGRNLDTFV